MPAAIADGLVAFFDLQDSSPAFGELEVYNGRIEPVRKLHFDIAGFDQAIIISEFTILRQRTGAALVAKPPEERNLDLSQSAHLGRLST